MSTKAIVLCTLGGVILSVGLAGCVGSPPVDDGAPHSFSEIRIGRPRQVAEAPPPVAAPVPAPVQAQAQAPTTAPAAPVREAAASPQVNSPAAQAPSARTARTRPGRPAAPPPIVMANIGPVDPTVAARRVDAYLAAQGYSAEDSDQGDVRVVVATRMAEPRRLSAEAACSLEAMRRPDFSAANLTVRLAPGAGGLEVGVQSSFVEVNTNLISGTLVREACRSRGVVEAGVRQAAQGG